MTASNRHSRAATPTGHRHDQFGHSPSTRGQGGRGQTEHGQSGHALSGHERHGHLHPDPATPGSDPGRREPVTARDHFQPHTSLRKDTTVTTTMTTASARSTPSSTSLGGGTAGWSWARGRVSGWALARLVFLLAVQVVMITALMTDHASTALGAATTATTTQTRLTQVAFTAPLAPTAFAPVATRSEGSRAGGSMTCAGRSADRDHGGSGNASATGFNLNVVVGRGGQPGAGAGPLVVTCGEQGHLMILACSPLDGDTGRAPAVWNQPPAGGLGRAGWAPAGWDQPGWRGTWRRDWRAQGLSDDQLDLLNQLDPDQLRALLDQRYPSNYQGYPSNYQGYGGGSVAGLSLGGMRISIGSPTSLHQLPLGSANTGPYRNPYADPYGGLYASGWGTPAGSGADSSWSPAYSDYGAEPGPSSLDGPGYLEGPDSPTLIASHHHSEDDSGDDPDGDRGRDGARGGWGDGGGGQRVAVCRWIGQR